MGEQVGKRFFSGIHAKVLVCLAVVLTVVLAVAFAGGLVRTKQQGIAAASEKSTALAQQMDSLWDYLELHQNAVPSNGAEADAPVVSDENGSICIISVKSVAERFSNASTSTIRYTSLRPRNTEDAPDEFERLAMELFQKDPTAISYEAVSPSALGEERYRCVQPLWVEDSCLPCHGQPAGELDSLGYPKEGYELGDLVGAISITTPMADFYRTSWQTVFG